MGETKPEEKEKMNKWIEQRNAEKKVNLAKSLSDKVKEGIAMLQDKLTKFVFKMKLDLLPLNFAVKDCNQTELLKACIYLGECEVQLDHVYERKNILRVLGLNMERSTNGVISRESGIETKTDLKEFEIFALTIIEEFEKTAKLVKQVLPTSISNKEIRETKSTNTGREQHGQSGYGARGSGMMQSDRGNPGYQQRFQEPLQERLAGSEDEFY